MSQHLTLQTSQLFPLTLVLLLPLLHLWLEQLLARYQGHVVFSEEHCIDLLCSLNLCTIVVGKDTSDEPINLIDDMEED